MDLEAAQKLSPDDKGVKQMLGLLVKREKHFAKKEKQTYAKMFAAPKVGGAEPEAEAVGSGAGAGEAAAEEGAEGRAPTASSVGSASPVGGTSDAGDAATGGGGTDGHAEGAPSPTTSPGESKSGGGEGGQYQW